MSDANTACARPPLTLVLALVIGIMVSSAAIVYAVCSCGGGDGIPLTYSPTAPLTMDGDVADWGTTSQAGTVLSDDDNNVCDGPSGGLTDLDAPVQSTGRDIVQFSYTYDDTWLYFYTERTGSTNNTQTFIYYADVDNDGYQEDSEPVIVAEWQGNNRTVNIFLAGYNPVDAINGDSTVDSAGMGDGYALPGNLKNISSAIASYSGRLGSANGLTMEFGIEWSSLGFSEPVGHTIHVSSTNANKNANNLGAQIDDNLGGCGGGGGTTQYANLDFSGGNSLSGLRGSTVYGVHHLLNLGNGDDSFSFAYTTSGTHSPAVSLYLDDGDAVFDTGDTVIAGSVAIASGASVDVITVYSIGTAAQGTATVITTATSEFSLTQPITVADSVTDTVLVNLPDIILLKSLLSPVDSRPFNAVNPKAIPGAVVNYEILATNTGDGPADTNSVYLRERVPPGTELYVGSGSASPVLFSGSGSGLTYTFADLASTADDLAFTSESGAAPAYTYTPTGDPDGYDSAVTGFQVNPKGSFLPAPGSSFTLQYKLRLR